VANSSSACNYENLLYRSRAGKAGGQGFGACYATDEVVVKGRKVGFMYREEADGERDSGWRFMAGDEDQDYMDNPDNLGVYDINLIANIDPSVVAHLASRIGSAFERDADSGRWVSVQVS
jgi:hypothetical protein